MSILAAALLAASAATPVTSVRDAYPSLSPDGTTLLFHSNRSGRTALYVADADGGNVRVLYDKDEAETPAWSYDGKQIAFVGVIDGQSEIFVMSSDGGDVRRLTDHPGDDSHPHWSKDGRIFFNSARTTPDLTADWSAQYHEIFSMKADGSDLKQHTTCKSVCTFPSPSPDGKYVAHRKVFFNGGRNWDQTETTRNSDVVVFRRDGKGGEKNLSDSPAFDGWPVWTPDSRYVVFSSNRDGAPNVGQIYAIKPDGTGIVRLTYEFLSHAQPSVAPAGDAVLTYRNYEDEKGEFGHIAMTPISLP